MLGESARPRYQSPDTHWSLRRTHVKVLESARGQADFHSLSTPDQSVKLVFVRTRPSKLIGIVLVVERRNDVLGIGTKQTRRTMMT